MYHTLRLFALDKKAMQRNIDAFEVSSFIHQLSDIIRMNSIRITNNEKSSDITRIFGSSE